MHRNNILHVILLLLFSVTVNAATELHTKSEDSTLVFDDTQLEEELIYPDWFKFSLGDLRDDLNKALKSEKHGIVTYFGQKRCAYCEQFIETSLADKDIQNYLGIHFL